MKVIIADDHPLIRESMSRVVEHLLGGPEVFEASTAEEVKSLLDMHPDAEMLLLDLVMPGAGGFSLLRQVRESHPAIKILVLSASEDPAHMRQSLAEGAAGFIGKSSPPSVIMYAIRQVANGRTYEPTPLNPSGNAPETGNNPAGADTQQSRITPRQREVLYLLCQGKTNKQIASTLELSEHTVKIHVASLLRVLGAHNRTQAALMARQRGLLKLD
jgi:DNA-binding NarL/FixJ family response regulator